MITQHLPIVVGPVGATICVIMASDRTQLSFEMGLDEAEALLADFDAAVVKARAWREGGDIWSVLQ